MDLEKGYYYKYIRRAWASDIIVEEDLLGEFIRKREDLPDWNNSVYEFRNEDRDIHIFRARSIHTFIKYDSVKVLMEKAFERMNNTVNGKSLKQELINAYFKTDNVSRHNGQTTFDCLSN
jgi:hypothetical protein